MKNKLSDYIYNIWYHNDRYKLKCRKMSIDYYLQNSYLNCRNASYILCEAKSRYRGPISCQNITSEYLLLQNTFVVYVWVCKTL